MMCADDDGTRVPASQDPEMLDIASDIIAEGERPATTSFSHKQIERVRDLLGRLYGARRAVRFYPQDHPAVDEAIDGLMSAISTYHDEGVDLPLTFFEDELLLGQQILPEDSVLFDQLIRDMTAIGAGSVTFERGLEAAELKEAIVLLAADESEVATQGGLSQLLKGSSLPHVTVGAVAIVDRHAEAEGDDAARASYGTAIDLLRDLEMALRRRQPVSGTQSRAVVRSLVENVLANRFAMLELAGLKDYDEYTFYHSVNVAILSLALGSAVTQDRRFLNSLGAGALMHDVGKMTVEGEILNKPGPLTSEEWAKMRLHPVHGAELVATMPGIDKASVVIILEHHMRADGRGYPAVRSHRGQHLTSRIVAVADAFDAMTSRRSYSAARLADDAIGVLVDNMGTSFDARLVRLFVRMMGVYPPRSVVRLDSGEVAVVLAAGATDLTRPAVRVISGPQGEVLEPFDLDLGSGDGFGRSIERCLDPEALNVDLEEYL